MKTHVISPEHLSIDRVKEILKEGYRLELSEESKRRIQDCRDYLDKKMESQKEPIYGITTGFGSLGNMSIGAEDLRQLQKNLGMSHACGTGELGDREIVKLIVVLKIKSLSYGYSGT